MTYLHAILLGVVQGLGEFLPISSSAHLVITPWFFGFEDPGLTFDVALHFGTLIALLSFFWKDWVVLIGGAARFIIKKEGRDKQSFNLLLFLAAASVPGAIAGLALEDLAETVFRSPLLIAMNMAFMGAVLWIVDSKSGKIKKVNDVTFKDSIFVGISQALALVPGVSRSGITMTSGLLRGLTREAAARFSFLLAMPITFGACLLKVDDFLAGHPAGPEYVGIAVSALVGFLSIKYLLKFIQTYSFKVFVYYRFIFAAVVVVRYLI